jgi:hypothetical protein
MDLAYFFGLTRSVHFAHIAVALPNSLRWASGHFHKSPLNSLRRAGKFLENGVQMRMRGGCANAGSKEVRGSCGGSASAPAHSGQ